jgi:stage V sporulation protein D (sporulation-specific penicillin-binding protein)
LTSPGLRRRIACLLLVSVLAFGALTARLLWVQGPAGEGYARGGLAQRLRAVPVQPPRGEILDRRSVPLAVSVTVDSAYAVPAQVRHPAAEAARLALILHRPAATLLRQLTGRAALVWIARRLSSQQAAQLRQAAPPGVGIAPEAQRFYPQGELAAQVLGFAGIDNQGLAGVELSADRYLRGRPGRILLEQDALNRDLPDALRRFVPPTPGDTVTLTLDRNVQLIARQALRLTVASTGSAGGSVIVMNPRTGGILALANWPSFDPNAYARYPAAAWRNPAVSDLIPPGSTFKPLTLAAALQDGVVTGASRFYDPGYSVVNGVRIRCWKHGGHGSQDLAQVVENSCNTGFVDLGLRLGTARFYRFLERLGVTRRTGVDLPGEARPMFPRERSVRPVDLAVMSFGQTLAITPLGLLTALCAIANGGVTVRPHVVRKVQKPDGQPVSLPSHRGRRVLSRAVAAEVTRLLTGVVAVGTGKKAAVPGYRVAGKTGTAQVVVNGRYQEGAYLASFIGFAPVPDPRVAVLVLLDRPQGEYYGGQIAAPLFAQVVGETLRYLGVPPQETPPAAEKVIVPDIENISVGDARSLAAAAGLRWASRGRGDAVLRQLPAPGSRVPPGSTLLALRGASAVLRGRVRVPALAGARPRAAAALARAAGLAFRAVGSGRAVAQDPLPGTPVRPGSLVTAEFR